MTFCLFKQRRLPVSSSALVTLAGLIVSLACFAGAIVLLYRLAVEDIGKTTLQDIGERLHLTREPNREDRRGEGEKIDAETRRRRDAEKKSADG